MPRPGGVEFRDSRARQIACCKDSQQSRRAAGTGALQQPGLSELLPQPCRHRLHPALAIVGLGLPTAAGRVDGRSHAVKFSNSLVGRRPPRAFQQPELSQLLPQPLRQRLHLAPAIVGLGRPPQPDELTTLVPVAVRSRQNNPAWRCFFILTSGTPGRTARGDFGATVGFGSYVTTRSRSGERPESARRRRRLAEARDRSPAQQKIRFSPTPGALHLSVLSL